jgi:starch synthase
MVVLPPTRIYQVVKRWSPGKLDGAAGQRWTGTPSGLLKRAWNATFLLIKWYLSIPLFVLFRELRRDECRSLLVQEYESVRFDLCALYGRLQRVRVFGTFTGAVPTPWFTRPLRRLGLGLCAGLVIGAKSEAERVRVQYGVPEDRLSLAYSPVDLGIFYPSPRDEGRKLLGIPSRAKVAMYHGRIELSYKGLDVLLEAWNLVCQRYQDQDVLLLLIGTGPDAQLFSDLITEKQLRGIRWHNEWVHDRDVIRRHLSSADVYVFPSRGDACPNAVIEAMACGLPIVASDLNGITDILEAGEQSGGILVPPGDARALAEALIRVLRHQSHAHELGRRARSRVEESFSMEVVGKHMRAFLLDIRP